MDFDDESEEVRRRMAALRSHLEGDVENVTQSARALAENARTMTNWRFVVRSFPFAAAGAAAALGFLLIPRKQKVVQPDPETIAQLAKLNQAFANAGAPTTKPTERGMLGGLAAIAASTAGKFALNWATAQLKSTLAAAAVNHLHQPAEDEAAEDVDEPISQAPKYRPR